MEPYQLAVQMQEMQHTLLRINSRCARVALQRASLSEEFRKGNRE